MLTIQQVGLEVLKDNPKHFYIFGGSEYGIKSKYIDHLKSFYKETHEVSRVSSVIDLMSRKQLIPLKPALYIVRYDEQFLSDLNHEYAQKLKNAKILGTIVCIYEQAANVSKCDKFLPDNTVSIDAVDTKFTIKYLHSDFPELSPLLIEIVAHCASNYGHAQMICTSLRSGQTSAQFSSIDEQTVHNLFGIDKTYSESDIKLYVASRNFSKLVSVMDEYDESLDNLLYTILATMLDLEKLHCNTYASSPLRPFVKYWTRKDIYNMFNNVYDALKKLRSITSDTYDVVLYILSLLQFQEIPAVEDMQ